MTESDRVRHDCTHMQNLEPSSQKKGLISTACHSHCGLIRCYFSVHNLSGEMFSVCISAALGG